MNLERLTILRYELHQFVNVFFCTRSCSSAMIWQRFHEQIILRWSCPIAIHFHPHWNPFPYSGTPELKRKKSYCKARAPFQEGQDCYFHPSVFLIRKRNNWKRTTFSVGALSTIPWFRFHFLRLSVTEWTIRVWKLKICSSREWLCL